MATRLIKSARIHIPKEENAICGICNRQSKELAYSSYEKKKLHCLSCYLKLQGIGAEIKRNKDTKE